MIPGANAVPVAGACTASHMGNFARRIPDVCRGVDTDQLVKEDNWIEIAGQPV
jgi:hypothetical protein